MRRELAIAFRTRATWMAAAVTALLVGHGFMLAVDLFSASSRSALASRLQAREMDPLAGIVRPTLGGFELAVVLFGPLVAARILSLDKERRTWGALCLAEGSVARVVVMKLTAALLACGAFLVSPVLLLVCYRLAGGHVDWPETVVALSGAAWRVLIVVAASIAAAAWTRTLAHAAALGIAFSLASWAIDAAEGFAALAWLGSAFTWSIEQKLAPFAKGIVATGSLLWLSTAAATAVGLAFVGASFTRSALAKGLAGAAVLAGGVLVMAVAGRERRAYDWTEARRASLPLPVVEGLRAVRGPLEVEVHLDRDDSRRRQVESDALQKLALARPDVVIRMPLDREERPGQTEHGDDYGRIVLRAGGGVRETRSTSRRELITLIFEAAGASLPEWTQPVYPGFPAVIEGETRTCLAALAYVGFPLALLTTGFGLAYRRIGR